MAGGGSISAGEAGLGRTGTMAALGRGAGAIVGTGAAMTGAATGTGRGSAGAALGPAGRTAGSTGAGAGGGAGFGGGLTTDLTRPLIRPPTSISTPPAEPEESPDCDVSLGGVGAPAALVVPGCAAAADAIAARAKPIPARIPKPPNHHHLLFHGGCQPPGEAFRLGDDPRGFQRRHERPMGLRMSTIPKPEPAPLAYFDPGDGRRIAYRLRPANPQVKGPTLMFLPGYASDMDGTKASEIDVFAAMAGLAYLRLDYSGTGSSGGDFAEGTLDRWLDEVVSAIDMVAEGPVLLIGSSMGSWLALHAALRRPDRVKAVVGIAAAPDSTDWGISPDERQSLVETARFERPSADGGPPQVTHARFVASGTALRLLHNPILLDSPVRLIHGDKDEEVPVGVPFKLLDSLHSGDVQLCLIKWGDHRLSKPHEIETIVRTIAVLAEKIA